MLFVPFYSLVWSSAAWDHWPTLPDWLETLGEGLRETPEN